ncbi:MAG TPA: hypothetical protein VME01_03165 [Solirubrobacteraceae bacterium]|nr:hypothetical protein [Solirubrobacteraceae bacterium]
MPAVRRARPKRFDYRKLPPWAQWTIPFTVAVVAVVALVVWVEHQTNDVPAEAYIGTTALASEYQQGYALMQQEQAPHHASLGAGMAASPGLGYAIRVWANHQIATGQMNGPLESVSCTTQAGSSSARVAMKCDLLAAHVKYQFYGVVTPARRRVTYCQWIEWPPLTEMSNLPLSQSCLSPGASQPQRPR